jgi:threonyl-tRNA synthetase
MLVVGDRESAEGTVSVRTRAGGDRGPSAVGDFVTKAKDEIASKTTM